MIDAMPTFALYYPSPKASVTTTTIHHAIISWWW
jgi:hypothetical protein